MKMLGLIGGTSWHSTVDYYRYINQMVNDRLGDRINPPLILRNLNQRRINDMQAADQWDELVAMYVDAGQSLIAAGVKGIVLCSNTAHKLYPDVSSALSVPILHIADATGAEARRLGVATLGLVGTRYTMEGEFLKNRLRDKFGLEILVPGGDARTELARIIADELSEGRIKDKSRQTLIAELDKMKATGATAMILGCTEFPLLLEQSQYDLPLLDTTRLHARMAVDFILSDGVTKGVLSNAG